ncbi:poor Imd response upon knock-in [Haematobia irritans]|uniref:poor Imd response upon knock-in n=1 Tax=Haematobia irritans TaxID=7368 RepID=UPI003F50B205
MGVRVFESNEDVLSDDDSNTCCSCSQMSSSATSTTTTTSGINNASNTNPQHAANSYWDIVDNCKEVSLETNTSNLRIVGNNNRIYITHNTGNLILIGNNTRLKVKNNHGLIKYTGNDGRISLGNESTQQIVDYIGCNGTLKIVNSMKFSKTKKCPSTKSKIPVSKKHCKATSTMKADCCICNKKNKHNKLVVNPPEENSSPLTENTKTSDNKNHKSKEKSHSYGGPSSHGDNHQWETFRNLHKNSMPNLNCSKYLCEKIEDACRNKPIHTKNIVQTIGNIVISNASNICISPYVRNITSPA